ncbi:MAG: DUF58 domain-containing protein [Candidatus Omnitrophica bacterium]|nr:DUF58 domain-containing protein [Candidatus Omnitrophota bacterium]
MISRELYAKIKYIDITTSRLVESVFAGEYHSVFKGKGIEFDEVREYMPGDDIRDIDWNVTAKTGVPYTKRYVESRELTVMLLIDVSASEYFGTAQKQKSEIIAEICAVLAFSAIKNNDRVGVLFFTDQVEKFITPQKGKRHVLRAIREILSFKPRGKGTDIGAALKALNQIVPKRATVFLFSDFFTSGYEKLLKISHRKHDMIGVVVEDDREAEFPKVGAIELVDAESGRRLYFNSSSGRFRKRFSKLCKDSVEERNHLFDSIRMDHIEIRARENFVDPLIRFFKRRERKARNV